MRKGFKELGISFGVFGKHERNADLVCREEVGGVVFETGVGDGGEGFWRERLDSISLAAEEIEVVDTVYTSISTSPEPQQKPILLGSWLRGGRDG